MNTNQAREISIEKVLQNLSCEPTKSNENESWYLSPFRLEKTASFKLNKKINRWFDHGEQKGGNVIDFVILKFGFTVSEALDYLSKYESFFSFQKQIFETAIKISNSNIIEKVIPIQHQALIQYLKSRKIVHYNNIESLKQIHYILKDKKYFGLGFKNNSGGFEIRSKYAKICIGKKDITHMKNDNNTIRIFEGFFDYLSFIQNKKIEDSDYLVLNSVALLNKNTSILKKYKTIELFLDYDLQGDKATEFLKKNFEGVIDCRSIFKGFKDYNEWFSVIELKVI